MLLQGKALRIIIYIGESDRYQGKSLHMALLEFLKQEGASGATVVRGLAGFGAKSRIHTASIVTLSEDLPLRLEWVDQAEVVERLLPQIKQMVDDGLITVEKVNVVQYAPGRRPDPLAQPVYDAMRREVVAVRPETPIAEAVILLLQKGYRSLPVTDEDGRLQGIITDGDLLRRSDLAARLDLQQTLSRMELEQQLAQLYRQAGTAASVMTQPVITVRAEEPVRRAVARMVEHGLKRLPVVDGNDRLVGWISRVDVLRNVEYHQPALAIPAEEPRPGHTVLDLMYRDVPTVSLQARMEEVIQALETSHQRRVVVVDEERRVLGIITDGDLIRRSRTTEKPGLLQRLRGLMSGEPAASPTRLLEATETAADLMSTAVVTITVDTPLTDALRLMLQRQIKRLPVVDQDGRLQGMLGRAGLLRGLLLAHNSDSE